MTLEDFLDRLRGATGHIAEKRGDEYATLCPVHEADGQKHTPSLSVKRGTAGIVVKCFAGCSVEEICAAAALDVKDLFYDSGQSARRVVATFDYCDETGALLFQVVRYEPKDFRQRRPDGKGGWIWNLDGVARPLYRLPELLKVDEGAWIFIVEGEKDVENIRALGLPSTCNSGGAGKWQRLADDSPLHGRRVCIIPDRDSAGKKHALDVANRLYGKAAVVKVIDLPEVNGHPIKDVSDWLDALDGKEPDELKTALLKMAETTPVWRPSADITSAGEDVAVCRNFTEIETRPLKWLWPLRIPAGKVSLLVGNPGQGKSLLTLDIAARVSSGRGWPDNDDTPIEPGNVILISGEDDAPDVIKPRLLAAEADINRISILDGVNRRNTCTGEARFELPALDRHLPAIEREVRERGARLLIIDPISAFLGAVDDHKNSEVRGLLAKLSAIAAQTGCAVLCVSHLRKSGGPAVHQTLGSIAYAAAARTVWGLVRDPQNRDRRLMASIKTNLCEDSLGLAFTIEALGGGYPRVCWERGPVEANFDDLINGQQRGPAPVEREEAEEWLSIALSNGPRNAKEIYEEAGRDGISRGTLVRAKRELGVRVSKANYQGRWIWTLPGLPPKESQRCSPSPTQNNLSTFEET